jgi:hypothetical protein
MIQIQFEERNLNFIFIRALGNQNMGKFAKRVSPFLQGYNQFFDEV